jgi:hypothetical protein
LTLVMEQSVGSIKFFIKFSIKGRLK